MVYMVDFQFQPNIRILRYIDLQKANDGFHADVPHFTFVALGNRRYVLVVIDEYTWCVYTALLALKSEVTDELLTISHRAYTLHERHAKNLRTDLGSELHTTIMKVARQQMGIASQHVPAE